MSEISPPRPVRVLSVDALQEQIDVLMDAYWLLQLGSVQGSEPASQRCLRLAQALTSLVEDQ